MGYQILGVGTATPQHEIQQDDAACMASQTLCAGGISAPALAKLYRRSGVQTRRCVLLESSTNGAPARQSFFAPPTNAHQHGPTTGRRMEAYEAEAADLAVRAARRALEDAQLDPHEVTHLVTASCTGFHAPGVDLALCEQLQLTPSVQRSHIGFMGCHAALNAIRVADAFARADSRCCVLTCAVELCSLHFQYSTRGDQVVSNSLFADGAAAVVGRGASDVARRGAVVATGAVRLPGTRDLMSWRIGDHGFEMSLSSQVPSVIRRELRPWMAAWLSRRGLVLEDIDAWAIHPGGPRILDACGESLNLSEADLAPSRNILAKRGNMSSPTVIFVLEELYRAVSFRRCVMLAFGPGLAIEAVLLEGSALQENGPT